MNVLILGSGGREHTLAWKIAQSPKLNNLFIAPGNAGTATVGTNVSLSVTDFDGIKQFVLANAIEMVVVGPETPLVNGFHDYFLANELLENIPVIGPQKEGAKLEGSKEFAKRFMQRHNIPTAAYQSFTKNSLNDGLDFLETLQSPYVLKADGLAAGKGVVILNDIDSAKKELTDMLAHAKFGEASSKVVIEEYLSGIELSVFILTDGISYKIFPSAKDYKRIGEGDTGLNTGGMGAISPVRFADDEFLDKVEKKIIVPTIEGLNKDGITYKGFLYFGLMNVSGNPYVIEYNVRMGDPEAQAVIPRIRSDLLELFQGVATGTLDNMQLETDHRTVAAIVLVSGGYPGNYEKGKVISPIENTGDSIVFHAGTKNKNGSIVTSGGRVIAVTSFGTDMESALGTSYNIAEKINFEGKSYRKDIGFDL
ncbi:MAG: phosphoribosylamine--glycine ligase [Bacteroidota bacterium]